MPQMCSAAHPSATTTTLHAHNPALDKGIRRVTPCRRRPGDAGFRPPGGNFRPFGAEVVRGGGVAVGWSTVPQYAIYQSGAVP
nr:hypothetical protein GCM10017745_78090 [Saccharothrix mutabilis subsp. capreolus]